MNLPYPDALSLKYVPIWIAPFGHFWIPNPVFLLLFFEPIYIEFLHVNDFICFNFDDCDIELLESSLLLFWGEFNISIDFVFLFWDVFIKSVFILFEDMFFGFEK